jgi:antitoxin component of MazEF toxin-antitoxin module
MNPDFDEVEKRREGPSGVVEPVRHEKYDLDEMLNGITAENLHERIDL